MHDFLVIGGGIAGLSAAARLSELGSLTLIEAEPQFGYHASGRSAALFEPRYGKPAVVALSLASAEEHHSLDGGVLSPRGMMVVAAADAAEAYAADVAAMRLQPLSPAEARGLVPVLGEAVAHVAHAGHAWDIDTDRLLQHFRRTARGNGAETLTNARATAIARTAGGWAVTTPAGILEARVLVNAAGAWADEIARMAGLRPLGLQPLRRSVARIPAPAGQDVSGWPMIFGAGESWYAKPDAGALIVSPAEEHPMLPHDAWPEDEVLAEGIARWEAVSTAPVTRLLSSWAGLRTFAPDRVLVLGPDPAEPRFVWVAGQGGYGFQTCPAASTLVADLVAGRAPGLDPATVAALSPARFG